MAEEVENNGASSKHKKRQPPSSVDRPPAVEKMWDQLFGQMTQEISQNVGAPSKKQKAEEPPKKKPQLRSAAAADQKQKKAAVEEVESSSSSSSEDEPPPPKKMTRSAKTKAIAAMKLRTLTQQQKTVEAEEPASSEEEFEPAKEDEESSGEEEEKEIVRLGNSSLFLMGLKNAVKDIEETWKDDLTEEEVKKYEWIFKNIEDMQLDVAKIVRANLSDQEKERAVYVMMNYQPNSTQYEEVARLINKRKNNPVSLEKLAHYEKMEQDLLRQTNDKLSVKFQILDLPLAPQFKRNIWDVYEQVQQLEPGSSDYHKHFEWIQWILRMPWGKFSPLPVFLDSGELRRSLTMLRTELDKRVYGMPQIKEEITLFSMDRFIPSSGGIGKSGKILCIEGSPGVGKTHLIRTLAKCWNLPFVGIAAGGCKDASFWEGHARTYEGAIPGRIVHAVKQMNTMNGVIYIDEIDKLSDQSQDVSSALMHLLDESQNSEWYDKFFGDIPLNLSKILWVLSINDRAHIHPVLRDRLHIIKVPDPAIKDKIETAKLILIPDLMTVHGLQPDDIEWPESILSYIITEKTNKEKGMRAFNQCIEGIIQRVAYLKHTLIGLPSSAMWHAAAIGAQQGISFNQIVQPVPSTKEDRDCFIKQTTFYFPDFRIPLTLTKNNAIKLLEQFVPNDAFDVSKSGIYV